MMSENEAKAKQQKIDQGLCIICRKESLLDELTSPRDNQSWESLYKAAQLRQFDLIISLGQDNPDISSVKYHRDCRSKFTHKKALEILERPSSSSTAAKDSDVDPRHSSRPENSSQSRIYDKTCIFCQRLTKYIRGTNTREPLTAAVELRADQRIRHIATERLDERILAVTSRDIVAAEAHYHRTCYKDYTRKRPDARSLVDQDDSSNTYTKVEKVALEKLYEHIRKCVFTDPQIVPLTELSQKLVSFIKSEGISEVTEATKKHLRRNLEAEFGESLHFFMVAHRVYVRPDNLTVESLATECVLLKKELKAHVEKENMDSVIIQVAVFLREQIKSEIKEQSWPPQPQELDSSYISFPKSLMQFLNVLLGGYETPSARICRLSWSMAQDILTAVSASKVLTPKHVLVPWVIKTLTGNVELIKTMNRLGHSCSYSSLEEIDTALCIEKLTAVESDSVPIPSNMHPSIPTVLAFDNIDRQEEVLSGVGTSHGVNGIIVQPTSQSCAPPKPKPTVNKIEKKRTIQPSEQPLPVYITGKKKSPPPVTPADNSMVLTSCRINAQKRNLWVLVREHDTTNQEISSWTGYNIMTRDDIDVIADTIGYLPTINSPATDMSMVQEILHQSLTIQLSLNLPNIAVVLDQALFAKATEIAWRYPDKYGSIVLMMGNFHTICNLMSTIGKMFGDAGLRDLTVESGIIAEGSINKVIEGKQYNRAVRFHKLTYEALIRLAWAGFADWLERNHPDDLPLLNDAVGVISDVHERTCAGTQDAALKDDSCRRLLDIFLEYFHVLRHERGPLSAFWMMYVELVELLLGLLRADREGDWCLHLACIRDMIPWCFAMDKINYARYLPIYYAQMSQLKKTSPVLHDHFQRGGFSVQISDRNPFGRIAVDQTTGDSK